jgi:hypothetical protein
MVNGVSSNTTLVPNAQLVFGGTASNRLLAVTPAANQSGTTLITVIATDADGATNSTSFLLTVLAANHAPALAAISNRIIGAGVTLTITNSATDTDSPPQTLTFALPVAPAGATITTNGGIFVWRPGVAQSSATNPVSVVVTDNGSPSMSATQSFFVTVTPLANPVLGAATATNGQFSFRISGDYGPDYFVQASSNLMNWSAIATNNSPTLPFIWRDTNANFWPSRFYRVILGP